jgi:hypothetical protein
LNPQHPAPKAHASQQFQAVTDERQKSTLSAFPSVSRVSAGNRHGTMSFAPASIAELELLSDAELGALS